MWKYFTDYADVDSESSPEGSVTSDNCDNKKSGGQSDILYLSKNNVGILWNHRTVPFSPSVITNLNFLTEMSGL
jgi:hypothetical protein